MNVVFLTYTYLHCIISYYNYIILKYVLPEYILEIYGKGEQQEELEEYSKELKISDNVKFMGQKANVQKYIVNASIFVSSSDYEGMSNSMLEYLHLLAMTENLLMK